MTELRELIQRINEKPEVITKIPWADETNGFEDSRIRDILMGVYPLEHAKVVADCILDAFNLCSAMCDVRAMGKNPYDKNDPMLYEKTYDMFIGGEWKPYNMEGYIKHLINKLENRKGAEKIDSIVLQCCSATPDSPENQEENDDKGAAATCNAAEETSSDVKRKVFEAIKTLNNEELIKYNYQYLWLKYVLEDNNLFRGSNQEFADWLAQFPFDEPIKGKLPKADNLKKYDSIAQYKNGRFDWLKNFDTKKKEEAEMLAKRFFNLLK